MDDACETSRDCDGDDLFEVRLNGQTHTVCMDCYLNVPELEGLEVVAE